MEPILKVNVRNHNGIMWPTHKRKASMRQAMKIRINKINSKIKSKGK